MNFGVRHTRAVGDSSTGDLLPNHDLVGERPPKKSRQAAWRDKRGLKAMTVNLPADVLEGFNAYLAKTGKNRNDAIAHLLRTQVLRKR